MCHCGLSRLVASAVSDDLPAIQCVVIHEDDPRLDKNITALHRLANDARFHSTVVVVAVPCGAPTPESRVINDGEDSDHEDFDTKIDGLAADLVSTCTFDPAVLVRCRVIKTFSNP